MVIHLGRMIKGARREAGGDPLASEAKHDQQCAIKLAGCLGADSTDDPSYAILLQRHHLVGHDLRPNAKTVG